MPTFDEIIEQHNSNNFLFVQVGANIGNDILTPYIQKYNWYGILIEPLPNIFSQLKQNYAHHPNLTFLNAAITNKTGTTSFFQHTRNSKCSGLSITTKKQRIAQEKCQMKEIVVPSLSMTDLITQIKKICQEKNLTWKLLQIDTEGYDDAIINMLDFTQVKPTIIRYEHKHLFDGRRRIIRRHLKRKGYAVEKDGRTDTIAYIPSTEMVCPVAKNF